MALPSQYISEMHALVYYLEMGWKRGVYVYNKVRGYTGIMVLFAWLSFCLYKLCPDYQKVSSELYKLCSDYQKISSELLNQL